MAISQLTKPTYKHRANVPTPYAERPAPTRAHRAPRTTERVLAVLAGLGVVGLVAVLLSRG